MKVNAVLDMFRDALDWLMTSGVIPVVVTVVIVGVLLWMATALARGIRQAALRSEVGATYGLNVVPRSIRVKVRRDEEIGRLDLVFPAWTFARKDGSADRRRTDNPIVRGRSTLRVGRYEISGVEPLELYDVVRGARRSGATVALMPAERRKHQLLEGRRAERGEAMNIDAIIARFADRPTDFEGFCADRFRERGFLASTARRCRAWVAEPPCGSRALRTLRSRMSS